MNIFNKSFFVLSSALFLFVACAATSNFLFPPPIEITRFNIDLTKENSFIRNIDFKTDITRNSSQTDNTIGSYDVLILSKSLLPSNSNANGIWRTIDSVYNSTNEKYHGEISFEWIRPDSGIEKHICGKNIGTALVEHSIPIGGFFIHKSNKKYLAEVKISVIKVDTLISKLLENPEIVIYRYSPSK
jgi:hypothetical protein